MRYGISEKLAGWCQIPVLAFLVLIFTSCASLERQQARVERDIHAIYANLYADDILQFYVDEAVRAGVRSVRKMEPADVLKPVNEYEMAGCAYGFKSSKTILIQVDQPRCVTLATLAHEISHIGANCSAHNDVFYQYNFALAKRYQDSFPDASTRHWFSPVQDVANVAAIYRSEGC